MVVPQTTIAEKLSERTEQALLIIEGMVNEMSVKGMEGIDYRRELAFLLKFTPGLVKLKQSLRARGQ